jgi:hypothetical protein
MTAANPSEVEGLYHTPLHRSAAGFMVRWARLCLPHYGERGSMDLDLKDFPQAEGPSYYNQFAHWALLLLSEGVIPGLLPKEAGDFRRAALKNIEYMLSITDADFSTPHYSRGVDWGRHHGDWHNFFLLRSLRLMEERSLASAELRDALKRAHRGAVGRIYERCRQQHGAFCPDAKFPGNHAVWDMVSLHEAGLYHGCAEWSAFAREVFGRLILPRQEAHGGWPEADGVVVNYAMVAAQAVSLYAEASGDSAARRAVERSLPFFEFFSFGDETTPVVADCRMRYSRSPFAAFLAPGFLRCAGGADFCLRRTLSALRAMEQRELTDNGAQGLAFYATFAEHLFRQGSQREWNSLPAAEAPALPVRKLSRGPWIAFLSHQLNQETPSRFGLDAQNFIEVWHREGGYLAGGGNSKYQPLVSTLRKKTGTRGYLPRAARLVEAGEDRAMCEYDFDGARLEVRLVADDRRLTVAFRALSQDRAEDVFEAGLMLPFRPGETVQVAGSQAASQAPWVIEPVVIEPNHRIEHSFAAPALSLAWRGRRFSVPEGAMLFYPIVPHNPYTQNTLPPSDHYIGRLSFEIGREPKAVVIE